MSVPTPKPSRLILEGEIPRSRRKDEDEVTRPQGCLVVALKHSQIP